jgi:hypothetical protein
MSVEFNITEWSKKIFNLGTVDKADFLPPHFDDTDVYAPYLLCLNKAAEKLVSQFTENFYDIYTIDFHAEGETTMEENPAGVAIYGIKLRYENKYGAMSDGDLHKLRIHFILELIEYLSDDTSNNIRSLSVIPNAEEETKFSVGLKWCFLDAYCHFKLEDAEREGDNETAEKIKEIRTSMKNEEQELVKKQQEAPREYNINDFIADCKKIDEAVDLATSGKINAAQQLEITESVYTKEHSDMLRAQNMADRDTEVAVWIIQTAAFTLNMNIVECYNKCIKFIEYHPSDPPIKLLSILGLVQAIMADNLFKLIHDELCVRENIVTQFNDLVGYAYNNLKNYEGAMSAEGVQEQMNDLNRKFNHAKAIIEYVRDGIEPTRHDTGEKLRFTLTPKQIDYVNSHRDDFDERIITLAKKQPKFDYLCSYGRQYFDSEAGSDLFDNDPEEAEKFVRMYCEYVTAYEEEMPFNVFFTFAATVSYFPKFMYNGGGFASVALYNAAVRDIAHRGSQVNGVESARNYLVDQRDTAGRFMMLQIVEDPAYASLGSRDSNWKIAFDNIESLAKQYGWVDPNEQADKQREQQRVEAQQKEAQSRKWRSEGKCGHCGGEIKGFFGKKCASCGRPPA